MLFRNWNIFQENQNISGREQDMRLNIDTKESNIKMQQVKQFCYLGITITKYNYSTAEMNRRISPSVPEREEYLNKHVRIEETRVC